MLSATTTPEFSFLKGGGEMGHLTRAHNWSQTPLGTPDQWPLSLRTTVGLVLHSAFPMFLFWGDEFLCFYNDAYRPSLGTDGKHPHILGKPGLEAWPEIREFIEPLLRQVVATGEPFFFEDQLVPIHRNGRLEDVYWTFSYSPAYGDDGQIAGVLVTCTETTDKVLNAKLQQEKSELLQAVFNDTMMGISVFRTVRDEADTIVDFKYQLLNRRAEQINKRTDLLGKRGLDVHPNFKQEGLFDDFITVVKTGLPIERDRHYTGEGSDNWYATVIAKHEDGVVFSFLDITGERNAQQRIEQSQQQLLALFEQSPVGIAIISEAELTFQMANPFYGVLVGRKPADLVGKPLLEALPELQGQGFDDLLRQVIGTGIPFVATEVAVDIVRQQQLETIYVDFTYQPRREADTGHITGVFAVVTDVTQQVRWRQRVEASEAKLRSLIASAPVGIGVFMGRDLVIDLPNQAFIDIVGKGNDIVGKPLREVMPELVTENQPFLQILDDVYTSGQVFRSFGSLVQIMQQGVMTHNYYNITYSPLFNESGEIYAILDIAVDVTGQIQTQQELAQQKAYLQNALDIADLGTFRVDIASNMGIYTDNIQNWFGLPALEQPMAGILGKIHPDDQDRVAQMLAESLRQEKQNRHDLMYRLADVNGNTIRHLRSIGKALFANGRPYAIEGIIQDVTLQIQTRQEIEQSEAKYRNLVAQSIIPTAVFTGRNMVLELANDAVLEFWQKDRSILGQTLLEFLPELIDQPFPALLDHVFTTGETFIMQDAPAHLLRHGVFETVYVDFSRFQLSGSSG